MKKLLFLSFTMFVSASLFSQSFDPSKLRVGGGFYFATEVNNIGLSLNGTYEVAENCEGALAFTHIFKNNGLRWNVFDIDGHYIFHESDEELNFYGLAGLSFTFWKLQASDTVISGITHPGISTTGSNVALNIGIGANYRLADNLNLAPEARLSLTNGSYIRIGATLQYMF